MNFKPIGFVRSIYKEKFGIPRQSGLVPEAPAVLKLKPEMKLALRGIDAFSHLWVLFVFHESHGWNPLVRPPRLGGTRKLGTFATRSPHRPNAIGMSVVKLVRVCAELPEGPMLEVLGGDFLDGTPILDIKPYIPYADSVRAANSGWAETPARPVKVRWAPGVLRELRKEDRRLIRSVLSLDPRPAFQSKKGQASASYSMRIADYDVHWRAQGASFEVTSIDRVES